MMVVILLLSGCSYISKLILTERVPTPEKITQASNITVETEGYGKIITTTIPSNNIYSDIKYKNDLGIPIIKEGFGIYGSSIEFDGVYPGWIGTVPLTIVNGQDKDRLFVIKIIQPMPSKVKEGYEPLPKEFFNWITISKPRVSLSKGETYQIPITLEMPLGADYVGKKAEVRIKVEDTTQTGLIQIALENRWFIITAS